MNMSLSKASPDTSGLKILITGASGGLGRALYSNLSKIYTVIGLCHQNLRQDLIPIDLTYPDDFKDLAVLFRQFKPDILIHTVAISDADSCERNPTQARKLNVEATQALCQLIHKTQSKMIYISSNDVFLGDHGMYAETDLPQPVNVYAQTKLAAEQAVLNTTLGLVLRTTFMSWHNSSKQSFVSWIKDSLEAGRMIYLSEDQFYSPLAAITLVNWIEKLFSAKGIYHLGSSRCSRFELGLTLAQKSGLNTDLIKPILMEKLPFYAARPKDSSLNCSKAYADYQLQSDYVSEVNKLIESQF